MLFSVSLFAACSGKTAEQAAGAAAPADAALQPAASHATAPATAPTVEGTVLETMDAANYTYVRVKTPTGEIWAATLTFKVAVGDRVVVPIDNPMQNFASTALKRTFPLIYFATDITRPGEPPPASAAALAGLPPGQPSTPAGVAQVTEPIPAAPGGMTVAKIWADRKALAGKTVTVRGKVVKFNGGILGLNWTHIQDGSGSAKDNTHDLAITSVGDAKVGDIITVTGTVVVDKDFTAGYFFPVIIQNATIVVK